MLLVLDAAAVVDLLLRNALGRQVRDRLTGNDLWSVAHIDAEVFSALSRFHRAGDLNAEHVRTRLELLATLQLERLPITLPLLTTAWTLRHNVTARDALYVAAAQALHGTLVTTDQRLARAVPDVAMMP